MRPRRLAALASLGILFLAAATGPRPAPAGTEVPPSLAAHSAEFEKRIYRVTDGVYSAVGFALANSILIEGDDGLIVVDVTESVETAREILAEFRKITDKPIVALVYTHNHGDHVLGGSGFVPDAADVDIYSHSTTNDYIDRVINVLRPILSTRSARMFGHLLPEGPDGVVNAGIGPFLAVGAHGRGGTLGLLRPNRTFDDRLDLEIAGVQLSLVHAPGETNDQIFVWLPEKRVLLPGDNIYKAFPNLYTIRGTLYRDVRAWVRSLDRMRDLRPEHVVPSHTRPFAGEENVTGILTAYRDAIQFVHDQTVRGMNRGLTPDELVGHVRLPPHLASHPYLQEHYGTVAWSVRNIFSGYLGWFDGDAATLAPVQPAERAAGIARLAGGVQPLLQAARTALAEGRPDWAAELAEHLLRLDPAAVEARQLKADALRALGHEQTSPNGRHYYLTQALELEGAADARRAIDLADPELVKSFPIGNILAAMTVNLDPERSAESDTVAGLRFTDTGEEFLLHIRRGVAELQARMPGQPDLTVTTDTGTWIDLLLRPATFPGAVASGALRVDPDPAALGAVLSLFSP